MFLVNFPSHNDSQAHPFKMHIMKLTLLLLPSLLLAQLGYHHIYTGHSGGGNDKHLLMEMEWLAKKSMKMATIIAQYTVRMRIRILLKFNSPLWDQLP